MPARLLSRALDHLRGLLLAQVRGWLAAASRRLGAAWRTRPSGARAGAMLLVLLLAGAGAAALQLQAGLRARLPSARDWQAAAALLGRDGRRGDAVVVAPAWLERAREVAPQGMPVLAPTRLAGERLPGVARVWLLAAGEAPLARGEAAVDLGRRAARADAQTLGALEVIRFDLAAPVLPLAVLSDRPPPGTVPEVREADGLPRPCLRLQPEPGGARRLPFPATRLGRTLEGHALRLPRGVDRSVAGGPLRLAFEVDGVEAGAVELGPVDGWRPFSIDTSRAAFGAHLVELVLTAPGEAAPAICLEALALP